MLSDIEDLKLGYKYKYPDCCIAEYINTAIVGIIYQGRLRGYKYTPSLGVYIPCWNCNDNPVKIRSSWEFHKQLKGVTNG